VRLRFSTAGESHGKALVTIVEGLPAGLPVSAEWVDHELARRMQGYGRGARMKIERDRIEWLSGVRAGETLGSPVAMLIPNRDWANWEDVMAYESSDPPGELRRRRVTRPRPGHADLSGVLKYDRVDARDILERASARETTARVAAGALAKRLLDEFGVEIGSHVTSLGGIRAVSEDPSRRPALPVPLNDSADRSEIRVLDSAVQAQIIKRIDAAKKSGDTLGGEVEVVGRGVVVGLGSHVSWDRKLDGRLAGMLMSIPAVKGVEIGMGFEAARRPGSQVHDPIESAEPAGGDGGDVRGGFQRRSNNAGGLEGGITTGEPLIVRVAMKPISTLMSPLPTVDLASGKPAKAVSERSDVTAVPAMGVIAEALMALVLADAMVEKFGGDSLEEMRRNYKGYVAALGSRWITLRETPAK
jgi:chorismate synthase